jgi:FKBP-type peptidyl-prolyl cis-trans isomerase FkpA
MTAPRPLASCVLGIALGVLAACGSPPSAPKSTGSAAAIATLQINEIKPGSGAAIAAGQKAVVNYTGWLYDTSAPDNKGKEFDSSRNAGAPFRFLVGTGQVIKGWDQGVLGMKVGGVRRLIIPPDLGYGDTGAGDVIPPGATLIFDVELTGIE